MPKRVLCVFCLVCVVVLGVSLYIVEIPGEEYGSWEGEYVTVTGEVLRKEYQVLLQGERLLIYLGNIQSSGDSTIEITNSVICYMKENQIEPELGSRCMIRGKVSLFEAASNPGQFDSVMYYRIKKIDFRLYESTLVGKGEDYSKLKEGLYRLRVKWGEVLERYFSPENASIMKTMLLGEKKELDSNVKELYTRAGIAHILAISGLHLSLIGMGIFQLLRKLFIPIWLSGAAAVGVIFLYGTMIGSEASSQRAIIMFTLHMIAKAIGRTYDMLTALAAAAVLLLLEQPLYLLSSGFLFSFSAILGIGLLRPVFMDRIDERRSVPVSICSRVSSNFFSSFCVTAAVFPVQLFFYFEFPLYSIIINVMILPLMSLLMILGFFVLLFGNVFAPAAHMAAFAGSKILSLYEFVCTTNERFISPRVITGRPAVWQIACYILLLTAVVLWDENKQLYSALKKKWRLRTYKYSELCIYRLLIIGMASLILMLRIETGAVVTFLDVGQGDAIHIRSDSGRHYLMDGGSTSTSHVGKYRIIPYLKSQGIGRLEAVFISHMDEDHVNGIIEMIEDGSIEIGILILADTSGKEVSEKMKSLIHLARDSAIPIGYMKQGDVITDGITRFSCMHPKGGGSDADANAASMVLKMEYGNFSVLLTGDVEEGGETMLTSYLRSTQEGGITVLKAAHHGSKYSTSQDFLNITAPQIAVISCGKKNSYGHPHDEVMERLGESGAMILTTPEYGAVSISSDGSRVRINTYKARNKYEHRFLKHFS